MKEDVIRAHAELPALCEQIHLPLQSGSSAVLKRMRRTYDRERYMDRVALIREHVPDCAITTDIIVGFPGETEADFAQTLEVVEEVGYDGAFTFVFSPRRETEAATHGRAGAAPGQGRADGAAGRGGAAAGQRSGRSASSAAAMEVLVEGTSRTDETKLRGRTRHNKAVNFEGVGAARRAGRGRDRRRDLADARAGSSVKPLSPASSEAVARRSSGRPGSARPASRSRLARASARARRGPGGDLLRRAAGLRGAWRS